MPIGSDNARCSLVLTPASDSSHGPIPRRTSSPMKSASSRGLWRTSATCRMFRPLTQENLRRRPRRSSLRRRDGEQSCMQHVRTGIDSQWRRRPSSSWPPAGPTKRPRRRPPKRPSQRHRRRPRRPRRRRQCGRPQPRPPQQPRLHRPDAADHDPGHLARCTRRRSSMRCCSRRRSGGTAAVPMHRRRGSRPRPRTRQGRSVARLWHEPRRLALRCSAAVHGREPWQQHR